MTDSRLERILEKNFCVTAEVVPPRSGDASDLTRQARSLVGYVDAANVTDNPTASVHMSAEAGVAFVAVSGIEPTLQVTSRDRNRLAITSELLGAWALGARNLLCLTGDPAGVGDHPDAREVFDLGVGEIISLASVLRDAGRLPNGVEIADPPRFFVGAADMPLAASYDPARLEAKLDAGARFVQTQIVYDTEALGEWADVVRPRGVFERASFIPGVAPLRSAKSARYMNEHVPGVHVPDALIEELEEGGAEAGRAQAVDIIQRLKTIEGIAGVHVMVLGHENVVREVIAAASLLPRPSPS